jgi:RNA polymerase sigma factor (TIGR02999 family)
MDPSPKKDRPQGLPRDVRQTLVDWSHGNQEALGELIPVVYGELRRLAHQYLRRHRPDNTLQPTAVVHEAYLHFVKQTNLRWQSKAQFFGIAANLIRQIIIDHARGHQAAKRGGGDLPLSLDEAFEWSEARSTDLLVLDEAMNRLAVLDSQQARMVELRFFGGLTVEETAEFLGVSPRTVKREWRIAKAWLQRELDQAKLR